jgi:hypothetical protein
LSAAFASSEEVCEALRWCQRSDRAPSRSTIVPTITKSKERLDEWEPHVKHYASSRLEAAGRAKLAKGAAAVMFALTWLVGGHFPEVMTRRC